MSFKPFFVHINRGPGSIYSKLRGATVYVAPSENPRECQVQITFCSRKDAFCKKTGRSFAQKAPVAVINIRKLATFLAGVDYCVTEGKVADSATSPFADGSEEFFYVYKYMV
jgi:hypothetical protein